MSVSTEEGSVRKHTVRQVMIVFVNEVPNGGSASGPEFNPWKPYLGEEKKRTPPNYLLTSPHVLWSMHTHAHTYKWGGERV